MKIRFTCLFCVFFIVSLTSCVPRVGVVTDTYSDPITIPQGFECCSTFAVIEPPSSQNVLLDREVRFKIERILMNQGYQIAHPECSQYLVYFFYGINFDTRLALSPLYTPERTIYTQRNANVFGPRGYQYSTYSQAITTPASIDWIPVEVANNTRWLTVRVFKKDEAHLVPIWHGASRSVGQSGDIRSIINYLLLSNFHFFGKSTHQQIYHSMLVNDKCIDCLNSHQF